MNRVSISAALLTVAAVVGGCGTADDHNDQDVAFARAMIVHHAQAVDMAELVPSRSTAKAVIDLAGRVRSAQDPEISLMRDWLAEWDVPEAAPSHDSHAETPGMMSADEMSGLTSLKGPEFDRRWLEMMIRHHQGAVDMAEAEVEKGLDAEVKALAQKVVDAQRAEISDMQDLLQL
ncbi:MAG TPA: DUF305 domain-containing protein [Actinokineospora sp.]|jgi:uncharacterized protein (DUF305 family)|nr:DUF305 domain-containing protein [Actinokineospora sp.]